MRISKSTRLAAVLAASLALSWGVTTAPASADENPAASEKKKAKPDKPARKAPTPEERAARRTAFFNKLDADTSGTVSLAEFTRSGRGKRAKAGDAGKKPDPEKAQKRRAAARARFTAMDADDNGELTLEEWNAPPKRKARPDRAKKGKKKADKAPKAE